MKIQNKLWIGLVVLIILTPLGLFLPEYFKAESAWGEWGINEIEKMIGYAPDGLKKINEIWKAPFPDYDFVGLANKGLKSSFISYIISAIIGVFLIIVIFFILCKIVFNKNNIEEKKIET